METNIKIHLCCATMAVAVFSTGLAIAQAPPSTVGQAHELSDTQPPPIVTHLQLTAAQKSAIQNAVRPESTKAASPVKFAARPGAPVPPSLELYLLPDAVLSQMPEAKVVKYTVLDNQIVLVDPTTMRVVDVIGL